MLLSLRRFTAIEIIKWVILHAFFISNVSFQLSLIELLNAVLNAVAQNIEASSYRKHFFNLVHFCIC